MARASVSLNCAMSLDGKIALPDRRHVSFGSDEDKRRMSVLRATADAVLIGGTTLRATPFAIVEDRNAVPGAPQRTQPVWNVVLSRTLDLPFDNPNVTDARVRWLVFTRAGVSAEKLAQVRRAAEVIELPEVTVPAVLEVLEARGVKHLLLEAGGDVSGQFFGAGRVDDVYVTLVPIVIGTRGAVSLADGAVFPAGQWPRLRLVASQAVGDELFLHYRRP
jgi:riboflavin-specific deaminase-like protein